MFGALRAYGTAGCFIPRLRAPRSAPMAQPKAASAQAPAAKPTILLDIMDTVVKDPFYESMPAFFGCTFQEVGG